MIRDLVRVVLTTGVSAAFLGGSGTSRTETSESSSESEDSTASGSALAGGGVGGLLGNGGLRPFLTGWTTDVRGFSVTAICFFGATFFGATCFCAGFSFFAGGIPTLSLRLPRTPRQLSDPHLHRHCVTPLNHLQPCQRAVYIIEYHSCSREVVIVSEIVSSFDSLTARKESHSRLSTDNPEVTC